MRVDGWVVGWVEREAAIWGGMGTRMGREEEEEEEEEEDGGKGGWGAGGRSLGPCVFRAWEATTRESEVSFFSRRDRWETALRAKILQRDSWSLSFAARARAEPAACSALKSFC